jgi:hypothetical protein
LHSKLSGDKLCCSGQSKNMGFSYLDILSKLFSTLKL